VTEAEEVAADRRTRLAAILRRLAWFAFSVLIVISPFRARIELIARPTPPVYGDFTDILLFWSDVAVLLTLGLWLAGLLVRRRSLTVGPRFLAWPIAAFLAVAWLDVPFALDVQLAAYNAIRLLILAVLGLYVVNEIGQLRRVWIPIAVMVGSQAVVAIGQVLGQHSLGLAGLGEWLLAPSLGVSVVTTIEGTRVLRGYGLADHPNILGGILAVGLVLLVAVSPGRSRPARALQLAVVGLAAVALLLTFSRGAWLALVVGLAVVGTMLLMGGARSALRSVALAGAVGALSVAPFALAFAPALAARTDAVGPISTEVRSIAERGATAELTAQVFAQHPITGVGLGGLPLAQHALEPAFADAYQPASFVLLDAAAETGIAGAALYLVIFAMPWLALWRARRRFTPDLAAASGVLAVIIVVGLFDYYTWTYPAGRIWAWLALALWAVAYRSATPRQADAPG
jgi:O-antigen ligase